MTHAQNTVFWEIVLGNAAWKVCSLCSWGSEAGRALLSGGLQSSWYDHYVIGYYPATPLIVEGSMQVVHASSFLCYQLVSSISKA